MPGQKRRLAENDADPPRKRRVEHNQSDAARLADIYNNLADELPNVRLDAAKRLMQHLTAIDQKHDAPEYQQTVDHVIVRLIKGVCSDRKAARLGFSIALAEVIRFHPTSETVLSRTAQPSLGDLVDRIVHLTQPEGNVRGQEKRNYLLGRRFAFQAILQSGITGASDASVADRGFLYDAIADLAAEKEWLRFECGAVLCDYLQSWKIGDDRNQEAEMIVTSWLSRGLLKTPEGVAVWVILQSRLSSRPPIFPKRFWVDDDPLSSGSRPTLVKAMLRTDASDDSEPNGGAKASGTRQSALSFAWSFLLMHLYTNIEASSFNRLWSDLVATPIFSSSSSAERKAMGLRIFTHALANAPQPLLQYVIHPNILRCVIDQQAKADRVLFEASKVPLDQMIVRGKKESAAAEAMAQKLIELTPGTIESHLKKTLDSLLDQLDHSGLERIVAEVQKLCHRPGGQDQSQAETKRRMLGDVQLLLLRTRRNDISQLFKHIESEDKPTKLARWLNVLLQGLVTLSYCKSDTTAVPTISDSSREGFRRKLMSCLSDLLEQPLERAILVSTTVASALHNAKDLLSIVHDEQTMNTIDQAQSLLKKLNRKTRSGEEAKLPTYRAFQLLFALAVLEAHNQEPDSLSVLEDLIACYQAPQESEVSSDMLVELLLSFISKPSALFRKLASRVFSAFAPDITPDGLASMLDILQQKESTAGQMELFDRHDDDQDGVSGGRDDDIDLEDASDVEFVEGADVYVNGDGNADHEGDDDGAESAISSSDASDEAEAGNNDEEAEFDRKLADALGTVGSGESDEDGSDMDDEQMMALEPHLTSIFHERKKTSSKKQQNREAKENMINFKSRVLELLKKYVESQYANPLALDLIIPLAALVRTTTSKPVAEKAFNQVLKVYFEACNKHKQLPAPVDPDRCFALLAAVHAEMKLGGSKLHANVCSRASLFLAKVLVALDAAHFDRAEDMYASLRKEWYHHPKSKIHGSVFTDWQNWFMSTRKHA